MKAFLQGAWLGHPLHVALVHVPAGLWPAALAFDLLANAGVGGSSLPRAATFAIALGLVVALAAVAPGFADWVDIDHRKPASRLGLAHLSLNTLALLVFAAELRMRLGWPADVRRVPAEAVWLSVLGTILVAVAAKIGSRMVFDYGTSVARLSKDRWRRIAAEGGTRVDGGGDGA